MKYECQIKKKCFFGDWVLGKILIRLLKILLRLIWATVEKVEDSQRSSKNSVLRFPKTNLEFIINALFLVVFTRKKQSSNKHSKKGWPVHYMFQGKIAILKCIFIIFNLSTMIILDEWLCHIHKYIIYRFKQSFKLS